MPTLDEIEARVKAGDQAAARVPLRLQIAEVEREIALRHNVYPKWCRTGKMRPSEAEEHQRRLAAVLNTLLALEAEREKT